MPNIKLTYFDGRGRCEHIRLILAYGGIKYEDVRIQFPDWPALKPSTPWGSLPVINVDGKDLGQSMAIARYAANMANIAGKTNDEKAYIDMMADAVLDMREAILKVPFAPDAEKPALIEKMSKVLTDVTALMEKNLGNRKFFGGDQISWADLFLYSVYESAKEAMDKEFKTNKKVGAIVKAVESNDKIKVYLKSRKETPF